MLQLDYRDARPIYEQVKDGLRRLVVTGAIQERERLPSVRQLAASLAINPNTIQKAYEALEAEGYVRSIPGKGSFASPHTGVDEARRQEPPDSGGSSPAMSALARRQSGHPARCSSTNRRLSVPQQPST